MSLLSLPPELLHDICDHASSGYCGTAQKTLHTLCHTSKHLKAIAQPYLYRKIHTGICDIVLLISTLRNKPHLAKLIKKIEFEQCLGWGNCDLSDAKALLQRQDMLPVRLACLIPYANTDTIESVLVEVVLLLLPNIDKVKLQIDTSATHYNHFGYPHPIPTPRKLSIRETGVLGTDEKSAECDLGRIQFILQSYTTLRELKIFAKRAPVRFRLPAGSLHLPHVTALEIDSKGMRADELTILLIAFPNLKEFTYTPLQACQDYFGITPAAPWEIIKALEPCKKSLRESTMHYMLYEHPKWDDDDETFDLVKCDGSIEELTEFTNLRTSRFRLDDISNLDRVDKERNLIDEEGNVLEDDESDDETEDDGNVTGDDEDESADDESHPDNENDGDNSDGDVEDDNSDGDSDNEPTSARSLTKHGVLIREDIWDKLPASLQHFEIYRADESILEELRDIAHQAAAKFPALKSVTLRGISLRGKISKELEAVVDVYGAAGIDLLGTRRQWAGGICYARQAHGI
ncbi:hypothetical protein PMZ80_004621 [Knufia obscura]|uniref:F-box domain-containing protein n=1 Tax=Knufia obscura TaxID=1635080 RepID=A0ABR0RTK1_9EURO|nr:hypothetical protein PMZ80_004621 [Knufia obscura]